MERSKIWAMMEIMSTALTDELNIEVEIKKQIKENFLDLELQQYGVIYEMEKLREEQAWRVKYGCDVNFGMPITTSMQMCQIGSLGHKYRVWNEFKKVAINVVLIRK